MRRFDPSQNKRVMGIYTVTQAIGIKLPVLSVFYNVYLYLIG